MPLLIGADRTDRLLADNLERTMSRHLVWNFTPGLSARSVALSYSGAHHALHDQLAIAWSSADCVAEAASLINAEELDGISPDERGPGRP